MNQIKSVKILTQSGLNLHVPIQCNNCCNITERKFCKIWAFPETKWNSATGCPDYAGIQRIPDNTPEIIENKKSDL